MSGRSRWHLALGAVLALHSFVILLFLSEMHGETPLSKWRHDGTAVKFGLVLFWYLCPVPSLLVSALAFNGSRLAAKQGSEFARIGRVSWTIIWSTCVAAIIQGLYSRVLIESDTATEGALQRVVHRGWIMSQLYTSISIILFIVVMQLLDKRRAELDDSKLADRSAQQTSYV